MIVENPQANTAVGGGGASLSPSFGCRPLRNVHHLPASTTIRQILQHFVKSQSSSNVPPTSNKQQSAHRPEGGASNAEQEVEEQQRQVQQQHRRRVKEFVKDLMALMEEALPVCLLYAQERPQWESLKAKEMITSVCDVYGGEYLLRLVVRLPILMPTVKKEVGQLIAELIVMLQKNRNACFKGNYREPQSDELLESEREWMQHAPYLHRIDDDTTATATASARQQRLS
jgi:hypothetical protein